jgi:hypothetical protein
MIKEGAVPIDIRYNFFDNATDENGSLNNDSFIGEVLCSPCFTDTDFDTLLIPLTNEGAALDVSETTLVSATSFSATGGSTLVMSLYEEDAENGTRDLMGSWSFGEITAPTDTDMAIDDALTVKAQAAATQLGAYQGIYFKHDGELPGIATVTIPTSEALLASIAKNPSVVLVLYEVTDGVSQQVSATNPMLVNVDGVTCVRFQISHCSEYALVAQVKGANQQHPGNEQAGSDDASASPALPNTGSPAAWGGMLLLAIGGSGMLFVRVKRR